LLIKQLEDFATIHNWQQEGSRYLHDCYAYGYSIVDRLVSIGIKSKDEAIAAVKLLESLSANPAAQIEREAHRQGSRSVQSAQDPRRKAIYTKVPDFFPTPQEIIDRMLDIVNVQPLHRVLDPSAGYLIQKLYIQQQQQRLSFFIECKDS
jgi:hypothetical protein